MPFKIVVNRKQLSTGINAVKPAISGRSSLPILSNVLLETGQGVLTVKATDLELGMKYELPCKVEGEGAITAQATSLAELLRNLPEDAELSLSDFGQDKLRVKVPQL